MTEVELQEVHWRNPTEMDALLTFSHELQHRLTKSLGVSYKYGTFVEIGSFLGDSTNCFASTGFIPVIAVDQWQNGYDSSDGASEEIPMRMVYAEFLRRSERNIFEGRIVPFRAASSLASLVFADASVNVVYIDGKHTFEAVLDDLRHWYPKVRKGGIISGHDHWFRQVEDAILHFMQHNANVPTHMLNFDDQGNWYFIKP